MLLWLLLFIFLGIILGILTGLIPGLHPNSVFVLVLSFMPLLAQFPIQCSIVFIAALAITNTFTDFLPSILFGAPEPGTALSVLPGHQMLLRGKGYEALFLTVVGGLFVCGLIVLLLPYMLWTLPFIYENIHAYIHIILIVIAAWMILTERGINRLYGLFVFLLAGAFGLMTLNSFPSEQVLFPALSGLFGLSTLAVSLMSRTEIPKQDIPEDVKCDYARGTLGSLLSGLLVGILPGVGAAQAGIISSQLFRNKIKEFLVTLGGINTANIFFTLIVFYSLGKTRSGASWTLSQMVESLTFYDVLLISFTCLFAASVAAIVTLRLGRTIITRLQGFSYQWVTKIIILFIVAMALVVTGPVGVLIMFTGFCLGTFSILLGINRTHLMGFLMVPTILYFSGIGVYMMGFPGV